MARKLRIHFPGAFYHVIAHGNRLQKIFIEKEDYEIYLGFLKEYKQQFKFILNAYILMPDHVHFLIETTQFPLSELMQRLQSRYSRNFNLKYRKRGHLFQGRYRAILCEKEIYCLELSAYVHLNAVRAKLVQNPSMYSWSSISSYVKEVRDDLVDTDYVLAQFSGSTRPAGIEYLEFVLARSLQEHREDFYELKDQLFLGSDEFVESVQCLQDSKTDCVWKLSLPEIVSKTSHILKIPAELFYTSTRNRQGARGRSTAGYIARKLARMPIKNVAVHFGRDPAAISQGIQKLEKRLLEDKSVARAISELEKELILDRRGVRIMATSVSGKT